MVTDTGDEVPFALVAVTRKVNVPAAAGVKRSVEVAVGVAAAGVCVKATTVPAVCSHANVGAGRDADVATTVTGDAAADPKVTVWFWIGLTVGGGAACTVIVDAALAAPQTFDAVKVRLYVPAARPVALKVGVVVVALVRAPFRSVPPGVVPAVHETMTGVVAFAFTLPER